jgi:hypothetical protein
MESIETLSLNKQNKEMWISYYRLAQSIRLHVRFNKRVAISGIADVSQVLIVHIFMSMVD